ncbi:MAG: hypothetical protein GF315_08700 [candidate division Zixibacteria bacterium]|nr:hypothetical protein [candidate division Zixibacteria bacterium]
MSIKNLLIRKKSAVVDRWFDLIIGTYPEDSRRALSRKKDRFHNPIGFTISREIQYIYDQFVGDMDNEILMKALDNIIKIRSVQNWTASEAVSFTLLLKDAMRKELKDTQMDKKNIDEMYELDSRIDKITQFAFDIYTSCRERMYEIKVSEIKRRSLMAFNRLNENEINRDRN